MDKTIREAVVDRFLLCIEPYWWKPVFDEPDPRIFFCGANQIIGISGNRVSFEGSGDPVIELELSPSEMLDLRRILTRGSGLKD